MLFLFICYVQIERIQFNESIGFSSSMLLI